MWGQIAKVGAQLGSAYLASKSSEKGQSDANETNYQIAREQMDFQERMSSTAHQREVKDLIAAGLNPILSATGGNGASSPMGSSAQMQNTRPNRGELALATSKTISDIMVAKSQKELLDAQALATRNQASGSINIKTPFGGATLPVAPLVSSAKSFWNSRVNWLSSAKRNYLKKKKNP